MTMTRDRRICIVGSGPGGLMAACTLKKLGYRNITVLDKARDTLGGKCRTVDTDGVPCDTGAVFVLGNYPLVRQLVKEAGCTLRKAPPFLHRLEDGSSRRFGVPPRPLSPLKKAAEYLRIGLQLVQHYPLFNHAIGRVDQRHVDALSLPYREWVEAHGMDFFAETVYPLMRSFGTGYEEQDIPAVYVFKTLNRFTNRGNWLSLWNPASLPLYQIEEGYGGMWRNLCAGMDIRLGVEIAAIERGGEGGVVRLAGGEELSFDTLIMASYLDHALDFLDASEEEQAIFSRVVEFGVWQAILPVSGIGEAELIERNQPRSRIGHSMIFYRYQPDREWYYFFGYTGDRSDEEIRACIREDIGDLGGTLLGEPRLKRWKDFDPHFESADLRKGMHRRLEALQGTNNTWYVGALLDPFAVELVSKYSKELIERNFDV